MLSLYQSETFFAWRPPRSHGSVLSMCGIAGVFRTSDRADDSQVVSEMMARLERRGPDDSGLIHDGPATLGHRRLAILDLSAAGRQPMQSRCGRYVLVFNGEIYNYHDLQKELGLSSADLSSTGDTEILLHAWARWGADALPRLVGQFAFAVLDRQEERIWLARDRFGEKPLFFHHADGRLTFASALPALIQAPWVPRSLDQEAIAEYLTLRYVVAPRTVLTGSRKLPPGHLLCMDRSGLDIKTWYEPRFHAASGIGSASRAELVEEFNRLLLQATRRCLVSNVPVALLLSDGIDSNSIRASLEDMQNPVPSFTYELTASTSGLSPAREMDARGNLAMDLLVTPADRVEQMIPAFSSFTEPVGDGASLATWLLIRNAREHATVFLCGHGADEVLGGYRLSQDRFRLAGLRRLAMLPGSWLESTFDRYLNGDEPAAARRLALSRSPATEAPAAARFLIHRPLPVDDLRQLFGKDQIPGGPYLGIVDELYGRCSPGATDLDRIQEVMMNTFLSENILSFADSVAMDASAELRLPFLDRDLVQFVLGVQSSKRVSPWPGHANTKQLLRWWGEEHLDREITTRKKSTFNYGNLSELLASHGNTLRGYVLDSAAVRKTLPGIESWLDHPPEYFHNAWQGTLWALLALGIWCEAHGIE